MSFGWSLLTGVKQSTERSGVTGEAERRDEGEDKRG